MRTWAAAAVAILLLGATALGPAGAAIAQYDSPQQERPAQSAEPEPEPAQEEGGGGDDPSGPPIWAGLGLIVVAAVAGTLAGRARNRRRMRDHPPD